MAIDVPRGASTRGPHLEWEGKRTQVERIQLPFQVIETVNEPREKDLFSAQAAREALATGWRNKLIWGDNRLVCASLLKDFEGCINLIYIDPPFFTGADQTVRAWVGDFSISKEPGFFEEKAYRDTWGLGYTSYLQMMYDRLALMRGLLAPDGSIFVHLDWHVAHMVRQLLDEIFGAECFQNEIVWQRTDPHNDAVKKFGRIHDSIVWYGRGIEPKFRPWAVAEGLSEAALKEFSLIELPDGAIAPWTDNGVEGRRFKLDDCTVKGNNPDRKFEWRGARPSAKRQWPFDRKGMDEAVADGRFYLRDPERGAARCRKSYLEDREGRQLVQDIWTNCGRMKGGSDYPTQKPEELLRRIVQAASDGDDIVGDFFVGSGTTAVAAEQLGRRWVAADLGRFAIHTTRKRLLDIAGCKPFEVLNLGKYERQYWQGVTTGRDDSAYVKLMLQLYRAEPIEDGTLIHGLKAGIAVHVGPIDSVVTLDEVSAAAEGARELGYKRIHVLGWDWQMGLKETAIDQALAMGVQLSLKRIPLEIMDPRARERGDVEFFEMNHVDAAAELRGRTVQVFLEDFVIADLKLVKPEIQDRIERFSDYVDYWAVDFDYRDDTFHNQWQSFRTRKQPRLELESAPYTYDGAGDRELLVKVIDIFGNDTTKLLRVSVS